MGLPIARQTSSSTHGGAPITFSTITKAGGQFILRQTDTFTCPTHGTVTVSTASTTRKDLDGKFIARDTDLLSCGATLIGGDATVLVN